MSDKPEKEVGQPLTGEQKADLGIPEQDLTAERDSRVLPFVRTFLSRMGTFDFRFAKDNTPEAAEEENKAHDEFYEQQFMPEAMARGLRLTDLDYNFRLTQTVIEMLSARATVTTEEATLRIIPAAQEILAALGEQKTLMLTIDLDNNGQEDQQMGIKRAKHYDRILEEAAEPVFKKYEVTYREIPQIFAIMKTILEHVENRTRVTIGSARDLAESKLWGVNDVDEVTIQMLHEKCVEK